MSPPGRRSAPGGTEDAPESFRGDDFIISHERDIMRLRRLSAIYVRDTARQADRELLDHIAAAFTAGRAQGYAEGRNDRLEDERLAAVHDLACRTIGLRPHDGPPLWSVAS